MARARIEDADPRRRRDFLAARRESSRRRHDDEFAADYDDRWGELPDSHRRYLAHLIDLLPDGASVLDAACGTGRIWPLLLDAGFEVVGADQSAGMLEVATRKHPDVPTTQVSLQDLGFLRDFDGVTCVDAVEHVGPEDWPLVLERLTAAARARAHLYLTVELPDDDDPYLAEDADDFGEPLVEGESYDGVGYHFYPDRTDVMRWIDEAGLDVIHETEADGYRHLLMQRR